MPAHRQLGSGIQSGGCFLESHSSGGTGTVGVCSGDADGKIWFWDFKTTRNYTTINAHKGVVSDIKWNPIHPCLVASCSLDGTIKLWDKK